MHYQMMKRNPGIARERLLRITKKFSVEKNFLTIFLVFLFLGFLLSNYYEQSMLAISICIFIFVSSIFMTATSLQQSFAVGLFEPMKSMPISVGRLIPFLLLVDPLATIGVAIPTVLGFQVLKAILFLLWIVFAILFGEFVAIVLVALLGGRGMLGFNQTKNFLISSFLLLVIISLPQIFKGQIPLLSEMNFVFPFASVTTETESAVLLLAHSIALFTLYWKFSTRFFEKIFESTSSQGKIKAFRFSPLSRSFSLVVKDLKITYRNPAGLVGILLPVLITISNGIAFLSANAIIELIVAVSSLSPIILGLFTRAEGRDLDFLLTLPVSKKEFMMGKILSSALVISLPSLFFALVASFSGNNLFVLPISLLLPINSCLFAGALLFRYPSNEPGIPSMGLLKMGSILLATTLFLFALSAPSIFLMRYDASVLVSSVLFAILYHKIRA
ncbi:MAG: hypothetical protein QXD49_00200 [Archaeoglobaceae archaeon]